MSSYYSTAQLEEMRKKKILQELSDSIEALKNQLMTVKEHSVQIERSGNVEVTVFESDKEVGGVDIVCEVTSSAVQNAALSSETQREELDFSFLLISRKKNPTKLELELDLWINKIDERQVISEEDERARIRVINEVSHIVNNSEMDIEDKLRSVKMRVASFLEGASYVDDIEKEKIKSDYYEYCALCELLEMKPIERVPYKVERETIRMRAILEKRRQDEYIMSVVEEILDELGCHIKEEAVLDHVLGQTFSVEGYPLCDVFVGKEGGGIMFEPIGDAKPDSLEKRRQMENSANSVCAMYKELEERAAERGVFLNRVYMEPVRADEMCVQDDFIEKTAINRKKKSAAQHQRALGTEE